MLLAAPGGGQASCSLEDCTRRQTAACRLLAAHLSWCQVLGLVPCSSMSMRLTFLGMLAGHPREPSREVVLSQAQLLEEVQLVVRSWYSACSVQTAGHVGQCCMASDLHMEAHSKSSYLAPSPLHVLPV